MSDEPEDFLSDSAPARIVDREEHPPAPEPVEAKPDEAPPPEPEQDEEPQVATTDGRMVPLSALEKVRTDWKIKATKAETEAAELRRQLEEARRAPPPQVQQQQQPAWVNPAEDPVGYHQRTQEVVLNERLNTSEMILRDKLGDDAVNAAVAEFKAAAATDPTLTAKLYAQPHPYAWMAKEVERRRLAAEIGDDPAAYRARIAAEERAKWEEERATAAPPPRPALNLPPSLATARSAVPRGSAVSGIPTAIADIFPN